jgi:hypothetical protein
MLMGYSNTKTPSLLQAVRQHYPKSMPVLAHCVPFLLAPDNVYMLYV